MGTSGSYTQSAEAWKRVADAIVQRREERGWTQAEVARRGGLSLDRVQAFESGRMAALRFRARTVAKLVRGLEWSVFSIDALLEGGDAIPLETLHGEGLVREAVWIIIDGFARTGRRPAVAGDDKLWAAMDQRRKELRLTWRQVSWRADLDPANLVDAMASPYVAERLSDWIAGALQWEEGSLFTILDGRSPEPIAYPVLYPSELDRVERMPELEHTNLSRLFGHAPTRWKDEIQAGIGRGLGALIPTTPAYDDVRAILESGLPDHVQRNLMAHMATRRAEMEAMLRREAQFLIDQLKLSSTASG